jgi:hypothetical protein
MGKLIKPSKKDVAEARYKGARIYLLMVIMCTTFNVGFLFLEIDAFYLASVVIPYVAMILREIFVGTVLAPIALAIGAIYLGLLVLCWALSKHKPGWMIAACVVYGLDLAAVALMYFTEREPLFLGSMIFHAILIGLMVYGIICRKRKYTDEVSEEPETPPVRGVALRRTDLEQKHRILLQAEFEGHTVVYRRVKKVNELVIDGFVYDEMELGIEPAHSLSARIDGKLYEVGYDGKSSSYFNVDGTQKAKKTRWY